MLIDNRNYLRIHQRPLFEKLLQLEYVEHGTVIVEPSKKGVPTLKVMVDDKIQYVHSKYDPETEAEKLIENIVDLEEFSHVIFIGTGLGYHIKELLTKRSDLSFSIYEPNLEVLYQFLSLQNIKKLRKAQLKRIITTKNSEEIRVEIQGLYKTTQKKIFVYTLPSYFKQYKKEESIIMQELQEMLKNKRSSLATNVSFQKRWTINSIKNFPLILDTPNILTDIDKVAFKDKPAIIVAAGPSLNEEFENLKYIKEKGLAYIFSVGSAINALIEHEIYPDAACTYDPTEKNKFVFEKLKKLNITDIPLIFGSSVGYETLENYPGKMLHMFMNQDTIAPQYIKNYKKIDIVLDAPSIAVVTLQLLKMLGFNQIILVGQNLAFQGNSRYAEGIIYDYIKNELSEHEKKENFTVKSVEGKKIQTSEGFTRMRQQLEIYINYYSDIEVINTTKGGAHIEGTTFIPLHEVIKEKLTVPNNVSVNWFDGENSYDLSFVQMQIKNMQISKRTLERTIKRILKELSTIKNLVSNNQTTELENIFYRFDKEFNKIYSNSFYNVFIAPMLRVHHQRLLDGIQEIRYESNQIKKGNVIIKIFTDFLIDCKINIQFIEPYLKGLYRKNNNY